MFPTFKDGDIVFFRNHTKGKSILKLGQIVIINHPKKDIKLIKRLKFIGKNSVKVFGDNIELSDDSNKFGFVNNEEIVGIVTSKLFNLKLKTFLTHKKRSTFLNPK